MTYLEVVRRKQRPYYWVTKNFRVGDNKWRKVRKFIGIKPPGKRELKRAIEWIEAEALQKGYEPRPEFAYLDPVDAEKLEDLKSTFRKWFRALSQDERSEYYSDFLVRFTYNTNAIEGNRLSLRETAMILTEDIIPAGTSVNDYNETLNSRDAFEVVKGFQGDLGQRFLLRLHRELTKNTKCRIVGAYRDSEVRIQGSDWVPPRARDVPDEMKKLFRFYHNHKKRLHPVELAAVIHTKLVEIHPFTDGNGRTARLVMNWLLFKTGYPMLTIENKEKLEYYRAIEAADSGDMRAFVKYAARKAIGQFTVRAR